MARLILLFVVALIVFATLRLVLRKRRLSVGQFFAFYIATLLGLLLLFLGVTGKLHPLFALLGAGLPLLTRLMPWIGRGMQMANLYRMFRNLGRQTNPAGAATPGTSEITSRYLHMVLDHDTGTMDGRVLKGRLEGESLSRLALPQLMQLLQECSADADSTNLLRAYLDREHAGWQEKTGSDSGPHPDDPEMSEAQALDILGLDDKASYDDIVRAHRRIMQKIHPDRGGPTYLAAKINAAKDLLTKIRGKKRQ